VSDPPAEQVSPLAHLIRQLRRAAGLTQEELAKAAGVGVRTLRDLETGRAVRPQRSTAELLATALGLDDQTRAVFLAIARGRVEPAGAGEVALPPAPPVPLDPVGLRPAGVLLGRALAVDEVAALVVSVPHVTLTGLAGVGKTALAVTVGHHVVDSFPGGAAGLTVTDASTETEILSSAIAALGAGRLDQLGALGRSLLVVDSVDRGLEPALAALGRLRQLAPELVILATSRHPLGIPGEHEWPVHPLDVPAPTATEADIFQAPAVEFFLDRLRRVRRRPVGLDEAVTLAALVRFLGGVPLVLEIAAARGRVLELEEILARCLDPRSAVDPAGHSLRLAVLGSCDLLTGAERESLGRLATLRWRWSITMAEELLIGVDAVALVDRLVGLGLVVSRPDGQEPRFWLLDAVRDIALELAEEAGILPDAQHRHGLLIAQLTQRNLAELASPDPGVAAAASRQLDALMPDLDAALNRPADATGRRAIVPAQRRQLESELARWRAARGLLG